MWHSSGQSSFHTGRRVGPLVVGPPLHHGGLRDATGCIMKKRCNDSLKGSLRKESESMQPERSSLLQHSFLVVAYITHNATAQINTRVNVSQPETVQERRSSPKVKPKHRDRPLLVPPPPAVAGRLLMIGREGVWAGLHTVASRPLADSGSAAVSQILWLHFCTVGGRLSDKVYDVNNRCQVMSLESTGQRWCRFLWSHKNIVGIMRFVSINGNN